MDMILLLWMMAALFTVGNSHVPEDCHVRKVGEEGLEMPVGESLFLSFAAGTDTSQISLSFSDASNTCVLSFEKNKEEAMSDQCTITGKKTFEKDFISEGGWQDMFIYASNANKLTVVVSGSATTSYPLVTDYQLTPDSMVRWSSNSSVQVVRNCPNKRCLMSFWELIEDKSNSITSFYVLGGDSVTIAIDPPLPDNIRLDGSLFSHTLWRRVDITYASKRLKVWVDGKLREDREHSTTKSIRVESIEMTGRGKLSWCDPTLQEKSPPAKEDIEGEGERQLKLLTTISWSISGLLVVILVVVVLLCFTSRRQKQQQEALQKETSSTLIDLPDYRPDTPTRHRTDRKPTDNDRVSIVSEHLYETVPEVVEPASSATHQPNSNHLPTQSSISVQVRTTTNLGTSHESRNSLYGELVQRS